MTPKSTVYGIPTIAIVAFVLLALLGVGMVLYAIFGLSDTSPQEAVPPTAAGVTTVPSSPTPASLPTQTSQPSPAPAKAAPATQAARPATQAAPAALAPTPPVSPAENLGPTLRAGQAVNIRSGPGTEYPVIGGLQPGNDIPLLGRDSGGNWLVIAYASGQGWVAKIVVTVNGDTAGLPVVAAPPSPPTAVPPTAAPTTAPVIPPPASSHGIVGTLSLCEARTTYAVNERICVIEKIYNSTNANVDYGILGVNAANITGGPSWFQSSWTGTLALAPGCTGPVGTCGGQWDDGFKLSAGTYHFTLDICYSSVAACQSGGTWETLTAPITVVVQ
jgi:hypothetical protein